ncbi:MAG: DUF493 domain-containing protein [Pseudomonadales bacterium]
MTDAPRIEFPCPYPIRIIGRDDEDFPRAVLHVVRQHAPEVTPDEVNMRRSSGGRYVSVAVTLMATGEEQLKALHADLMRNPLVKLVL